MYRRGVGGPVDEAKAIDHYTKAADAGIALARYRLALMLLIGRGAIQDVPRARALLEAAALQGHSPSRRLLDDLNRGLDPEKPKDP
jgi:TPR repeat protein